MLRTVFSSNKRQSDSKKSEWVACTVNQTVKVKSKSHNDKMKHLALRCRLSVPSPDIFEETIMFCCFEVVYTSNDSKIIT